MCDPHVFPVSVEGFNYPTQLLRSEHAPRTDCFVISILMPVLANDDNITDIKGLRFAACSSEYALLLKHNYGLFQLDEFLTCVAVMVG